MQCNLYEGQLVSDTIWENTCVTVSTHENLSFNLGNRKKSEIYSSTHL